MGGPIDPDDELVVVYSSNRMDAEMMRSVIEGSGITAVTTGSAGGGYPLTVGQLGAGRILVRREDEDAARDILAAASEGDLGVEQEPELPPTRPRWIYAVAVVALTPLVYSVAREAWFALKAWL